MPKYKIIVNPISGRCNGAKLTPLIQSTFRDQQINFDLVHTETPWHASALTLEAIKDGYDYVIAGGGDGTVNEVINGFMMARAAGYKGAAMGVISVGRGNDFAFSMGIPTDCLAGCNVIIKGDTRKIDVGKVTGGLYPEGRYFGNGVGIGFDAVVGFEAVKLKRLSGFPSYIVAALRTMLLYYNAPLLRVELDEKVIEQPCLMVSTMNGYRLGGGFFMTPESKADDGKFDICLVNKITRLQMLGLIGQFTKGTQGSHPAVSFARSSRVKVTALEGSIPSHADGETLCTKGEELLMEIMPQKIDLVYAKPE